MSQVFGILLLIVALIGAWLWQHRAEDAEARKRRREFRPRERVLPPAPRGQRE